MKLKKLHIQNFQSHKDTTITFTDGLNVIVGPTDTGKSAILRSLKKLIRDEPSGKAFISKWSKEVELTLTLTFDHNGNEHTVTRKITPSKNQYSLDVEDFGGFGHTIPQEIQDALDMELVILENGDVLDLHFTDQHDPPFMVAKGSAGTRSKLLGKIAGLHILDSAIARINSDVRAENSKLKTKSESISSLEYELEDFPDLWHELTLVDTLSNKINDVKDRIKIKEKLEATINRLQALSVDAQAFQARLKKLPNISIESLSQVTHDAFIYSRLSKIVKELNYCQENIDSLENSIPAEINADFTGIKERIALYSKLSRVYQRLTEIAQEAATMKSSNTQEELDEILAKHNKLLKELGVCPTCKRLLEDCHD